MSFVPINPPEKGVTGTGISISLTVPAKSPAKVRLTISAQMQQKLFGASVEGKFFDVLVGTDAQEGQMLLRRNDNGLFQARSGIKDGVTIWLERWDLLPRAPRKGAVDVYSDKNDELILKLPSWCKTKGKGGKLDPAKEA